MEKRAWYNIPYYVIESDRWANDPELPEHGTSQNYMYYLNNGICNGDAMIPSYWLAL